MAIRIINDNQLTAIADAIRTQLNSDVTMTPGQMPAMIGDIGVGYVPAYWRSYLEEKAIEINAALASAGDNRSAFLWYTDAHWTTNYGRSPMILRYLSKHTGINKTYFGGDVAVAASGGTDMLTEWLADVSTIPNHRSMIGNHDNAYNTDFPTAAERAEFFLQTNRTPDMVFGTDATNGKMYYYVDDHIEQTRYIVLSTGRMWAFADEVQWCVDALNSTPEGWHIIAASHLWLNNNYDANPIVPLETPEEYTQVFLDLFDAYNYRLSGTTEFASTAYDFANGKAKVEFVIGGHVHQDHDFATSKGIPVILTECDAWQERETDYDAQQGTTMESCVYAIVADYTAKRVKVINVGRGSTRNLTIPDVVNYTNWIRNSIDSDGAPYNGGKGYKENYRINSSGAEVAYNNHYITGFIPIKSNDVLRFKNMDYLGDTNQTQICVYNTDFTRKTSSYHGTNNLPSDAWSPVYRDDGQVKQLTFPSVLGGSSPVYIRICAIRITDESIITINEEID